MTTPFFDLGKLRYQFRGTYSAATAYESNDVVAYGGHLYCYIYALPLAGVLPTVTAKWSLMVQGMKFMGAFSAATAYHLGEVVKYGSGLFLALVDTVAGQLPSDAAKWATLATGMKFQGAYAPATAYAKDDIVTYGAYSYIATGDTTGNLPTNVGFWTLLNPGMGFQGAYAGVTAYHKGDVVTYGGGTYLATQDTTGNPPSNATYWSLLAPGVAFQGAYAGATAYHKGDIVTYGSSSYIALQDTTGNLPTDAANWTLAAGGLIARGAYAGATAYFKGDVVVYGNSSYIAKQDTTGNLPTSAAFWNVLATGIQARGAYAAGTAYNKGDIVVYGGNAFMANGDTTGNLPSNVTYWTQIGAGLNTRGAWAAATNYVVNDIVAYGANTYLCTTTHASSALFPTDLASKWTRLVAGMRYMGNWVANTPYLKDDVVTSGSSSYIALADVASAVSPSADAANWNTAMSGSNAQVAKTGDTMSGLLTLTGGLAVNSIATMQTILEKANIVAAAPAATQHLDLASNAIHFFTAAATANFTMNLRGNAGATLDSTMAIGQALSLAVLITNGATPFYPSVYSIDGANFVPKWNGLAPTSGNASAIDSYTITVIKTAAATFTVLATRTKFA